MFSGNEKNPKSDKTGSTADAVRPLTQDSESSVDTSNFNEKGMVVRNPKNLMEYYLRIDTPERLYKMIKRFKLEKHLGDEEIQALFYFNPEEIPQEKQMLKPVRRAVLAMLSDIFNN